MEMPPDPLPAHRSMRLQWQRSICFRQTKHSFRVCFAKSDILVSSGMVHSRRRRFKMWARRLPSPSSTPRNCGRRPWYSFPSTSIARSRTLAGEHSRGKHDNNLNQVIAGALPRNEVKLQEGNPTITASAYRYRFRQLLTGRGHWHWHRYDNGQQCPEAR